MLRPTCATGRPKRCGGPTSNSPRRKQQTRDYKSELSIRPIWHQREDRVLAHILGVVLPRLCAVEDARAVAEPGRARQQSTHDPPGTRRHTEHRRRPADRDAAATRPAECAASCVPIAPGPRCSRQLGLSLPERLRMPHRQTQNVVPTQDPKPPKTYSSNPPRNCGS